MLKTGDKAPHFEINDENGDLVSIDQFKGKKIILYFYPKDNTPGCTKQAIGFTEMKKAFEDENCIIIGASKDSVKKHQNFIAKQNLNIKLLSDEAGELCEDYDVWVLKKLYGREYMGIERSTFLIDENQIIQHIWRKVKVKNHIEDVLSEVKKL